MRFPYKNDEFSTDFRWFLRDFIKLKIDSCWWQAYIQIIFFWFWVQFSSLYFFCQNDRAIFLRRGRPIVVILFCCGNMAWSLLLFQFKVSQWMFKWSMVILEWFWSDIRPWSKDGFIVILGDFSYFKWFEGISRQFEWF